VIAGRTRDKHLFGPGPKRILALDGGGVRGIISLAYLERLEAILRERFGPDTVLADYFDLIGGASTGAIIATGLALGLPVKRLIATYS
jgi:patatin-like phospholipase/acyl hydrolase